MHLIVVFFILQFRCNKICTLFALLAASILAWPILAIGLIAAAIWRLCRPPPEEIGLPRRADHGFEEPAGHLARFIGLLVR